MIAYSAFVRCASLEEASINVSYISNPSQHFI